jgi:arginine decarboxylase
MAKTLDHEITEKWKVQDALDLYNVRQWGKGYFGVSRAGHVTVHPNKKTEPAIDLKDLVDQLTARGIQLPILLRFTDILRHRVGEISEAFQSAIAECEYGGEYSCVYPIKVNQQRHVVEEIVDFGRPYNFGLEAGSKPELLAVLAMTDDNTPIICNGFKDDEFIRMAMLARKIGKQIVPVVEKFTELEAIVRHATELEVRPAIGVRVKLAARGAGRWRSSAGFRAKFGLTLTEVLELFEYLKARDMADCLQLVHFHIGSQITNIRKFKDALTEAARVYTELHRLGAGVKYLDVGGGLGVDYDGSQTDFESSINYTLQEYATDVVFRVKSVCDEAGVPHPTIITESGRAVVAYHSVLVFDVLGASHIDKPNGVPYDLPEDAPQPLADLYAIHRDLNKKNYLESYHDAIQHVEESLNLFTLGYLPVEQRAMAERLFWSICCRVQRILGEVDPVPEELENLGTLLADTYFCNFSVFQSMPDSWAVKQLFPILPIHRLDERPNRSAVLGDITCDSDGKVDQFCDLRDVKATLSLHEFNGEPYYLGAFLLGAYQEILGDLHNLFGDTNAVHVSVDEDGIVSLDEVIKGDTVREVLHYVQYSADKLATAMRRDVEKAVRAGKISVSESRQLLRFYETGLEGYTYLEEQ